MDKNIINYTLFRIFQNNSALDAKLGLFNGTMGDVMYLCVLNNRLKSKSLRLYIYDLLQDIYNGILSESNYFFDIGLLGIGWGIQVLINLGYLVSDENDVCEEIDDIFLACYNSKFDANNQYNAIGMVLYAIIRQDTLKCPIYDILGKYNLLDHAIHHYIISRPVLKESVSMDLKFLLSSVEKTNHLGSGITGCSYCHLNELLNNGKL